MSVWYLWESAENWRQNKTTRKSLAKKPKTLLFGLSIDNLIFYHTGLHLHLLHEHFSVKTLLTTYNMKNEAVRKNQNQSLMWNINSSFLLFRFSSINYDRVYNHLLQQLPVLYRVITLSYSQGTNQTLLLGIFIRCNILHNLDACINIYCWQIPV